MTSFANGVNVSLTPAGDTLYSGNAYLVAKMLERALPMLVFEKFGQAYSLPTKSSRTMKFRRYESLDGTPRELVEGVTPQSQELSYTEISVDLRQYGNLVVISDVALDTADTDIAGQASQLVGEQAALTVENLRIDVLMGGSNVEYSTGNARNQVNNPMTLGLQRRIVRKLKRQLGKPIYEAIASSPRFYTENVWSAFVAVCHSDCEADIRSMEGFKDAVDYGTWPSWENEIGAVEGVRYVTSTLLPIFPDAGGAATNASGATMVSTSGTNADVYPILFFAKDAYGITPLKGADSLTPAIINPTHTPSDPLAQRMYVSWKTMQASVILNQAWLVRAEVAVTAY